MAFQKNQHFASHVATIFCNHLAKLLQKIIASQKTQHIQEKPTHHMMLPLWRTKKVALSALGENLLRNVVQKVDNAKITT